MPSMILLGIGAGMAFNPVLLAAMGDVAPEEAGLASGVVNTSFMMGGALGLAVLASLAAWRTDTLLAAGESRSLSAHRRLPRRVPLGALFAALAAGLGGPLLARRVCRGRRRPASRRPRKRTRPSARARRTKRRRATSAARPPSTSRAAACHR